MSAVLAAPRRAYVGFWLRLLAVLIDWLSVVVVSVPAAVAIYGRDYPVLAREGYAGSWDFAIQVVFPLVAVVLFWRAYGATPGKMAIGAKIVDAVTAGPPAPRRLVIRLLAYLVSALPLGLGFLWIAFDRRKQGWHDKIAGTVVVTDDE